jgi:uncharacterized lipoprotein YddW (UPF0748 family)
MTLIRTLATLWVVVAFLQPLPAQTPPKREFRAAWVTTVSNLDWPSTRGFNTVAQQNELITIFDNLKANGISVAVFQVRSECDAMYQSSLEPWSYYLTGVQGSGPSPFYDPLESAIDAAHDRGMELHAWFNPFRAYRYTNTYTRAANHVTNLHPEWVITTSKGYMFLDPGNPEVRRYVAAVFTDVMRRYDIDGIHMDDYLYPYTEYGTWSGDEVTFAADPRGFTNIHDWRRDNVSLVLRMLRDSIQAISPHVKLGMSPFGIWKNNVPPGIVGMDSYSVIYCDAIAWLRDQSVDYLTPQLYWQIGGPQDYSKLIAWWADSTSVYGRHLYPGLASYRINSHNWSVTEVTNMLRLNRGIPAVGGEMYFRANSGVNDNPKGFADSLRDDFYRYPALHPVMAWKDSVHPYPPRGIQYAYHPQAGRTVLQWELPLTAPDGDSASRYAVYLFDHYPAAAEFEDPANLLSVEGQRFIALPEEVRAAGSLYLAVTALDRNYNESDTSNILKITAPTTPLLASPADGAANLPESVKITWRPAPLASSYRLQVSTDPAFSSGVLLDEGSIVDTFRVVGDLLGQAAHYWRVSASNLAGTSTLSSPFHFLTGFPTAVMLLSPPDVTEEVPVDADLVWSASPAATSYHVQLSPAGDFSVLTLDSTGLSDTTVAVQGLDRLRVYFWRVMAENAIGSSPWSGTYRFRTVQVTSVAGEDEIPTEYALEQNYPNPFNAMTTIRFAVPETGRVVLKVYDMLGRERATLVDREMSPGTFSTQWDASDLASGVYLYRLVSGSFVATKRMIVLK